ncbi:MAG TPA: D-cysteine desulfhydrase [Gammaproteobacteria bacterium]
MQLAKFNRVRLGHLPTPLEPMDNLRRALGGGPRLWIKRDDCTGLATGGNKTRKLEFLMAEALAEGADTVITQGAVQSNHVRQTTAAACRLGLSCHGLLERRVPAAASNYDRTGNVFLDRLLGASYEFRDGGVAMEAESAALAERLRAEGRKPYVIPGGGSNPVGALGYANCALELTAQSVDLGVGFDWLVHATGSTGTQAGLLAGLHGLSSETRLLGVSVRQPQARQVAAVHRLTQATAELLGLRGSIPEEAVEVDDRFVGAGYGQPAASTLEAIELFARSEGILLDPVYSGKGAAGLIGRIREGFFSDHANVVFLHTGGSAALFAYEDQFAST